MAKPLYVNVMNTGKLVLSLQDGLGDSLHINPSSVPIMIDYAFVTWQKPLPFNLNIKSYVLDNGEVVKNYVEAEPTVEPISEEKDEAELPSEKA